ncbi:hypothetical protein [Spirosoma validum]|uniref:Uncharacterized protein n=1 Tax=Spirosoma validum TaxID=2771355 RepID=A0A927B505_9BACT|nr:hypothetical protein [Spirosoma validum]MBD2755765.1 hypothetical protein [Spirosoma validum]
MKRILTYLLAGGFLLAAALMIYIYQEYMGEDTDPTTENQSSPIINKKLNAIVLRIAPAKAGDEPKIDVTYTDLDTKETTTFPIDNQYGQSIHIGDTLTKEKGEKIMLIYQKAGKIETVPVD